MAIQLDGRPGLVVLGSLLLAIEANNFLLTTANNCSRLMNEVRTNVLGPRCGNCTTDLQEYSEWPLLAVVPHSFSFVLNDR